MKTLVALSDPSVFSTLSQAIAALGESTPSLVADSDAVVEWINTHGGCDLLVSEVYLTPTDGFALRDALLPYLPDLKVIYTSPHDVSPYLDRFAGAPFLSQPITANALAEAFSSLGLQAAPPVETTPAAPSPLSTPKPSPRPVPSASAPKPRVAGAPTPQSKAAKPAAKPAAPTAKAQAKSTGTSPDLPPDDLVGKTIGHYLIEARIRDLEFETFYRATQTNIGRQVILRILKPELVGDPAMAAKFMDDARARAKVTHTLVTTVYESGEHEGMPYSSNEFVPAPTLEDLIKSGQKINPVTPLEIVKSVGEVFDFFNTTGIQRARLLPRHIILKAGSPPRLWNMACKEAQGSIDQQKEVQNLINMLLPLLAEDKSASAAHSLLIKIRDLNPESSTWKSIATLAESGIPKAKPADAQKIQAQSIARVKAVEDSKKMSHRNAIIYSAISLTLTLAACFFGYKALSKNVTQVKDLGKMIQIPAGEMIIQGQNVKVPAFKISKYEVSIQEYAAFLKDLRENPGKEASIAHPNQPPGKSHIPTGWADMNELSPPNPGYYARAKKWGRYQEVPLSIDSPVFGVDWYDAYAYAKWKGQRLPTEQEWERAARGENSYTHPWGSEPNLKLANTGSDFSPNPDPKVGGQNDGFKRWSPVDKPPGDVSGFEVYGTAGNVSEWTATWAEDTEKTGEKVPVYRGGNWKTADEKTILRRGTKLTEFQSDDALGFRTATDSN